MGCDLLVGTQEGGRLAGITHLLEYGDETLENRGPAGQAAMQCQQLFRGLFVFCIQIKYGGAFEQQVGGVWGLCQITFDVNASLIDSGDAEVGGQGKVQDFPLWTRLIS